MGDKELFNSKTVKRLCSKIKLSHLQKRAAKDWLYLLNEGKLKQEKLNYFKFGEIILKELLGFDIRNMSFEEGNIEFSFKNKKGKTVLGIEAKGTKTKDLFAEQKGYREGQRTPIHQLWRYMGDLNLDYGFATNYKEFVLLERSKGTSAYHFFDFEEIRSNEEKLKEFIAIFSKEQIIDKGFIEKLEEESAIEEKNFTKEFYKLFHETRLMLLKEFQKNDISKEAALHFSQLFINRLMFILFAEDTDKLEKRILEKKILNSLENIESFSANSNNISNLIAGLFRDLNTGTNFPVKIFGFNGGLFKHPIPPRIYFNDFRNESFFKDVYQYSKLKDNSLKLNEKEQEIFNKYKNRLSPIIKNLLLMASFDFNTEVSVNILGHIFEQSLTDLEELKEGTTSKRKKEGIFYTPEYITDYICRNTIIPYLSKKNAKTPRELVLEYANNIKELEKKFSDLKIIDPACGSGAFLIKAVDVLLEIHKEIQLFKQNKGEYTAIKKGRKVKKDEGQLMLVKWHEEDEAREIIEKNIFGVDINEESVEITKLSLFLKIVRKNKKLIDLSDKIKCGNSLIDDEQVDPNAFDWEKEFPFKFDIVIGNPPYVVLSPDVLKNYALTKGNYNTYIAFFERAFQLLKSTSNLGLIVPITWFAGDNYNIFRDKALKHYNLTHIIQLPYDIFEAYIDTSIVIIQNGKYNDFVETYQFDIKAPKGKIDIDLFKKFNKKTWIEYGKIFLNDSILKTGEKVWFSKKNIKLNKIARINRGSLPPKPDEISEIKDKHHNIKWFNDQIFRYTTIKEDETDYYVNYDTLRENKPLKLFQSEKILARQLISRQFRMNLTYVNESFAFKKNLYAIYDNDKNYDLKYILTVLNSKLFSFCQVNFNTSLQRDDFPAFSLKDFKDFSIANISPTQQKHFIKKADIMLETNKKLQTNISKFIRFIKSQYNLQKTSSKLKKFYFLSYNDFIKELKKQNINFTKKEEYELMDLFETEKKKILNIKSEVDKTDREIDEMVYKLYGITKEEQKIIEESLK
ncbi:N-6 DNA methylase [Candidatus Woesearchaeota archaeon]|nr:N-6 DNA methylase [Candidatus Woesearchaeota archaeon]